MKTSRSFWDTSAIVPLCLHQEASAELRRLKRSRPLVAAWWGVTVEARSALARLSREGELSAPGLQQATARLAALRSSWLEVLPSDRLRNLAETLPDRFGLRALDSLQLAAALIWCRERPRGRGFVCSDQPLSEAAAGAGFQVLP